MEKEYLDEFLLEDVGATKEEIKSDIILSLLGLTQAQIEPDEAEIISRPISTLVRIIDLLSSKDGRFTITRMS